jgi:hypothetical protein
MVTCVKAKMLRVSVDTRKKGKKRENGEKREKREKREKEKNGKILEPRQKLDPVTSLIRIREVTATILIRLVITLLDSAIRLYDHLADIDNHSLWWLELQKTA